MYTMEQSILNQVRNSDISKIYTTRLSTEEITQIIMNKIVQKNFDTLMLVDMTTNSAKFYVPDNGVAWTNDIPIEVVEDGVSAYLAKYYYGKDKEQFIEDNRLYRIVEKMQDMYEYSVDFNLKDDDGRIHFARGSYYWLDESKDLMCFVRRDITDVAEKEQLDNIRLNEAISHVNDMNKKLIESNKALHVAGNAKMEFLSRMSHDIRTPMNAIIGMTSLAFDDIDNPQAIREYLTKIKTSSEFLLGLVNDILDMEKIESGAMKLSMAPYKYDEFLGNMRTMFEPLCKSNGLKFEFPENTKFLSIITDKVRLNQIFFNILSNAIKFTPEGGTISYRIENMYIHDNVISANYIVEDTGIGMSKEFQKNIFKEFVREEKSMVSQTQGTGLGLAITKNLVELMGGHIGVESKEGKGTKITVNLSFQIAHQEYAPKQQKKTIDSEYEQLKGKRILLVEDHPLNTEIAKKLLEKKGMIVYCAEDGKVAVDKFSGSDIGFFDGILMDIRMPVMDGITATKHIRAMERKDAVNIPIIAMTANAYDIDIEMCKDAGMDEHLAKPVDTFKLYDTILEVFNRKNN